MKVVPISKKSFFRKFNVKEVDLVAEGLFTKEDLLDLRKEQRGGRILSLGKISSYLYFSLQHPSFFVKFIIPAVKKRLSGEDTSGRRKDLKEAQPIKNCILKASIAAAFGTKTPLFTFLPPKKQDL